MNNIIGSIILEGATTVEDVVVQDTEYSDNRVVAEGTLQDTDVENRNHRIYEKQDIEPEINGPRMKELLSRGELTGEAGHPLSDSIVRQQTIDPKYECVRYLKIWMENNLVKAQFKGTNNELGETFDKDLRSGVKPAFSLRALGAIENVNNKAYVRGVRIITYDRVHYPSHKVAYTEKIISESAIVNDLVNENQIIVPENDPGRIIQVTGSDAQDILNRLQRESASISSILDTFEGISDKITVTESNIILTNRCGDRFNLKLEDYVDRLIMNYTWGKK